MADSKFYHFVVTYTDGTLAVYANEQRQKDHQIGARCYRLHEHTTIVDLIDAQSLDWTGWEESQIWGTDGDPELTAL